MKAIHSGTVAYASKHVEYFSGARADFVAELPEKPDARILEIGCAAGNTGALALAGRKCGWYSAVELDEKSADQAKEKLNEADPLSPRFRSRQRRHPQKQIPSRKRRLYVC